MALYGKDELQQASDGVKHAVTAGGPPTEDAPMGGGENALEDVGIDSHEATAFALEHGTKITKKSEAMMQSGFAPLPVMFAAVWIDGLATGARLGLNGQNNE
jgi:hypothetical protein